ncbi:MAG: hypothetical protein ACT4PT_07665 [Methanobacteriota archaeon]
MALAGSIARRFVLVAVAAAPLGAGLFLLLLSAEGPGSGVVGSLVAVGAFFLGAFAILLGLFVFVSPTFARYLRLKDEEEQEAEAREAGRGAEEPPPPDYGRLR